MKGKIVQLNAGISIAISDPSQIFPHQSITLPNITFTSPLVNAPVPISELKLNFINNDMKHISNAIQEAKQFPSKWLHCPYVSVYIITEVNEEIKKALNQWKFICTNDNLKMLLVFAPMKIPSNHNNNNNNNNNNSNNKTYDTLTSNEIKSAEQQLKVFLNDNKAAFIKLMEIEEQAQSLTFRRRTVSTKTRITTKTEKLNWQNIIFHIIELASIAFANRCLNYQNKIKKLEETKNSVGWNVGLYLLIKESLGLIHVQVNLVTVALQLYSEINTFFNDLPPGPLFGISCNTLDDDNDHNTSNKSQDNEVQILLDAHLDPFIHERIRHGKALLLEILFYLFSRQVNLLEHIGLYGQLHLRAAHFLRQARPLYRKHVLIDNKDTRNVESIDILTICLVIGVQEKMEQYKLLSQEVKMPYAQKLEYGLLLLLGRASCMRVAKLFFTSKNALSWSNSSSDLIDPSVDINPFDDDSSDSEEEDDDNNDDTNGESMKHSVEYLFFSTVKSNMCKRMLKFNKKTCIMFDSSKLFRETIKQYFLIPGYIVYAELGHEYKRHLLYLAVDLAYIHLQERNYINAAKYFETIDSIYIQDNWKRYETINCTWLAYTYKQLLSGQGGIVEGSDEYTSCKYKYVNTLLSLVHRDAISACPEILPFIVPRLISELIKSKKTTLGGERRQRGDGLLTFIVHFEKPFISGTIQHEVESNIVTSTLPPFEISKKIPINFQIINKTFETIAFDNIKVNITGKDGNGKNVNTIDIIGDVVQLKGPNSPTSEQGVESKISSSSSSSITLPSNLYILTPGENRFEVSFVCQQTCTIYFKEVVLYIGHIMLNVGNIDLGLNASNITDPTLLQMKYLSVNILNMNLFCENKCSVQMKLIFLHDLDEDAVDEEVEEGSDNGSNNNNNNNNDDAVENQKCKGKEENNMEENYIEIVKFEISTSDILKDIIHIDGPPIKSFDDAGNRPCFFPLRLTTANEQFQINFLMTKSKQVNNIAASESIYVKFTYKRFAGENDVKIFSENITLPIPNEWQDHVALTNVVEEEEVFDFNADARGKGINTANVVLSHHHTNDDKSYDNFVSLMEENVKFDFKKCTVVGEVLTVKISVPLMKINSMWKNALIQCFLSDQEESYWMLQGNQTISLLNKYDSIVGDELDVLFDLIPLKIGKVNIPTFMLLVNANEEDNANVYSDIGKHLNDDQAEYHDSGRMKRIALNPSGKTETILVIGLGKVLVSMV